jgi:hypothetical protein
MDIAVARKCEHNLTISDLLCNLYGHNKLCLYSTAGSTIFIGITLLASGFSCSLKTQQSLKEEQIAGDKKVNCNEITNCKGRVVALLIFIE